MRMRAWFVIAALAALAAPVSADSPAAPPRQQRTGTWQPALLEPGSEWWCRRGWDCRRDQFDCDLGMKHLPRCVLQKQAWAVSSYHWGADGTSGTWVAKVVGTRAACNKHRRLLLANSRSSSVSPCVAVASGGP